MTSEFEHSSDNLVSKGTRRLPNDLRAHIGTGLVTVLLLVGGLGAWAATTELSGAVIGSGTVVVDTNVKKVQHSAGGIVGEINVREGGRVNEGDVLIRLDETLTRANLGVIMSQLNELEVRQAGLLAEREGVVELRLSRALQQRMDNPDVQTLISAEQRSLEHRRAAREGKHSRLGERLKQLNEQVVGLQVQHQAKLKELEFINIELQEIEKLWQKNLAPLSKRIQLLREFTRIEGEGGQIVAALAQTKAKIAETQMELLQIDSDLQSEVSKELREVQAKHAELSERRVAADDQLRRVDLRSPQSGIVHQLNVHTVGGVIERGDVVMLIVPVNETIVLDVKIGPQDVSQVRVGQDAMVRFTSFNMRTTPEVKGKVTRVGADLTREQQGDRSYFMVRIAFTDEDLQALGGQRLQPGMPAEVYIQTERRTALSYIVKPLVDQTARAFKER